MIAEVLDLAPMSEEICGVTGPGDLEHLNTVSLDSAWHPQLFGGQVLSRFAKEATVSVVSALSTQEIGKAEASFFLKERHKGILQTDPSCI